MEHGYGFAASQLRTITCRSDHSPQLQNMERGHQNIMEGLREAGLSRPGCPCPDNKSPRHNTEPFNRSTVGSRTDVTMYSWEEPETAPTLAYALGSLLEVGRKSLKIQN